MTSKQRYFYDFIDVLPTEVTMGGDNPNICRENEQVIEVRAYFTRMLKLFGYVQHSRTFETS